MRHYLYILTLVLCTSCTALEIHEQTLYVCADMPAPVASATVFVADGKAYVFGGRLQNGTTVNNLWEYNPTTDTWTALGAAPLEPRVNAVAYTVNDSVYIGLGYIKSGSVYTDSSYLRDFWLFVPSTGTWTRLEDYPYSHTNGCAAYCINRQLYIGAGYNASVSHKFYIFDLQTRSWKANVFARHPDPCTFAHCSGQVANRCFIGTGFNPHSYNTWFEFIPSDGTYHQRQSLPTKGRDCATATATDEYIYVIGGQRFGGTLTTLRAYDDVLRYSPATDSWQYCGKIPDGGTLKMISFTINNEVYFGLGEDLNGNIRNTLYSIK